MAANIFGFGWAGRPRPVPPELLEFNQQGRAARAILDAHRRAHQLLLAAIARRAEMDSGGGDDPNGSRGLRTRRHQRRRGRGEGRADEEGKGHEGVLARVIVMVNSAFTIVPLRDRPRTDCVAVAWVGTLC